MIVVHIYEGLGNQLFQYAFGRATAARHGTTLAVDNTWYRTNQGGDKRGTVARRFKLDAFQIEAPIATRRDMAYHRPAKTPAGRVWDKVLRLGSSRMANQMYEKGMWYQPEKLEGAGPSACVIGYWQCERYFAPVADTIRREFRLKPTPQVLAAQDQADRWRREAAGPLVSVHVRRGDLVPFMLNGQLQKNHGPPTSAAYVRRAMELFPAGSRFVVVADVVDREWARQNLGGSADVVYYDGPSDIADFAMLRSCDHNVAANSTFSWWAAWLNDRPGRRVVVPTPWFWPDGPAWKQSDDLIPPQWTALPTEMEPIAV